MADPRALLALPTLLCACVSLPPEMLPVARNPAQALTQGFDDPGPEKRLTSGRRFLVKARDFYVSKQVSKMAEDDYDRLMAHTGLFHFKPGGLYPIVIYKDAQEYQAKTRSPSWSGGIAAGNAVYSYEGPALARTLAHEITHLLFYEYMGAQGRLRWFNEGLAVYEELHAAKPAEKGEMEAWLASSHVSPMPFEQMAAYEPGDFRTHLWYGQAASVARYLVETGGRSGVERFLQASKAGASLDAALAQGFPTLCDDLAGLEKHWLQLKE